MLLDNNTYILCDYCLTLSNIDGASTEVILVRLLDNRCH